MCFYLVFILQYFSLLKINILLSILNPDITLEIPSGSFSESEQNNFSTVIVIIEGEKPDIEMHKPFTGGETLGANM